MSKKFQYKKQYYSSCYIIDRTIDGFSHDSHGVINIIASFQPWFTGVYKALASTIAKLLTPPHK